MIQKIFDHDKKTQNCLICYLVANLRLFEVLDESWDDLVSSYGHVFLGNLLFLFIIFDSVVEMDFDYFIKCVELFGLSFGAELEGIRCFGRKLG